VAANRHAFFGAEHPLPDSDSDGLVDSRELALGLDPTEADTDFDYFRDGVEQRSDWLAPDVFDQGCDTEDLDSDGDGLRDCEEEVIGTDPRNPDTDGDYLPDALEYFLDGSPLSGDPNTDADLDKIEKDVLKELDEAVKYAQESPEHYTDLPQSQYVADRRYTHRVQDHHVPALHQDPGKADPKRLPKLFHKGLDPSTQESGYG